MQLFLSHCVSPTIWSHLPGIQIQKAETLQTPQDPRSLRLRLFYSDFSCFTFMFLPCVKQPQIFQFLLIFSDLIVTSIGNAYDNESKKGHCNPTAPLFSSSCHPSSSMHVRALVEPDKCTCMHKKKCLMHKQMQHRRADTDSIGWLSPFKNNQRFAH